MRVEVGCEIGGMLFTYYGKNVIWVQDINYQCQVGWLTLEDGPGWVLNVETTFLDGGQLAALANFVKGLNEDLNKGLSEEKD